MRGYRLGSVALAVLTVLCVIPKIHCSDATSPNELTSLRATGVLPAVVANDGVVHSFLVPPESLGNFENLNLLQRYCERYNRSIHIRFLGPVITQERLRQFRSALPEARMEHDSAVSFGITWHVTYNSHLHGNPLEVDDVVAGSPAAKAGVKKGDVILGIGEYRWPELDSQDSFQYAIRKQIPGQRTTVTVKRNGEELSLPIEW